MPWYITDGVLQRADTAPALDSILTNITGEGEVVIPEGVTQIESPAFFECDRLTGIVFPRSMERIGIRAVHSCSSLKSIRLPAKLMEIDSAAFESCRELSDIILYISQDINDSAAVSTCIYNHKGRFTGVEIPQNHPAFRLENGMLLSKDGVLLWADANLKNAVVPEGVTVIGDGAFHGCRQLRSVQLPGSLQKIGDRGFCRCRVLQSITLPSGVAEIGLEAFKLCLELKKVELNDGLKHIGNAAFVGCRELTELIVPESVGSVGRKAFSVNGLKSITVPAALWKSLDEYALQHWSVICCTVSLKEVEDDTLHPKLCIGFALNQQKYSRQLCKEYIGYIRENAKMFAQAAFKYPKLLYLMCGEKLIGAQHITCFVEEAIKNENVELTAVMLSYHAAQTANDGEEDWQI